MRLFLSLLFLIFGQLPLSSTAANSTTTESPYADLEDWKTESTHPQPADDGYFGPIFVKMIVLLTISLLFLFLVAWFTKRFLQGRLLESNRTSRIQILEKRVLSPKSCLYLIAIDDHHLLISEHTHGMQKLVEITGNRSSHTIK